ncbi:hypothetical protein [Brachybacterium sp. ACRRE]|uniref:hypothetical protein n=1 Tax=Brachybacterium sp. ACRRE TaxID=2918184 RepID=UPI001EF191CD|nr:hypothetical protein [Brachybacterium sp. ACRRE]MCG7309109.1 hypothetical protein [Brachybacterium sp. ACRRE]
MSAIATTHEGSFRPVAPAPAEHDVLDDGDLLPGDPGIEAPELAAVRGISATQPSPPTPAIAAADAVADVEADPALVSRPRPARSDELLRRCASLAARARVDAITDLEATSLHELREVLAEIHVAVASGETPPRAPLPCLAAAALEDLRHQLDQQSEDPSAARALGEIDRALGLLQGIGTAAE